MIEFYSVVLNSIVSGDGPTENDQPVYTVLKHVHEGLDKWLIVLQDNTSGEIFGCSYIGNKTHVSRHENPEFLNMQPYVKKEYVTVVYDYEKQEG